MNISCARDFTNIQVTVTAEMLSNERIQPTTLTAVKNREVTRSVKL